MKAFDAVFASVFGASEPAAEFEPEDVEAAPAAEPSAASQSHGETGVGGGGALVGVRPAQASEDELRDVAVPMAASDEEVLRGKRFDALAPGELAQLYRTDGAPRGRDAKAPHAPLGARSPRRAHRHAPHASREHAHRRGPDPPRAPAAARRPPPGGHALRHIGLDGAVRPRLPAVPHLRRGQRAERRGVRVRHAPDSPDARASLAQPGARDPARRGGRARTGRAGPGSATRSRRSTTATAGGGWRAALSW